MKKLLLLTLYTFMLKASIISPETKQLLVVVSPNWSSPNAYLQRYNYENGWRKVGVPILVLIGRNGLATAKNQFKHLPKEFLKKEGDGKAPAGIFELDFLFGYDQQTFKNYKQMDQNNICVDDSKSKYYNKIIDKSKFTKDWSSYEDMKRKDELYKYGIRVLYNTKNTIKNDGSCIFIHIKRDNNKPTAGCTAMSKKNIQTLFGWLDFTKKPKLIQLPEVEFNKKIKGILENE